jgi:CspA family cold shock protein
LVCRYEQPSARKRHGQVRTGGPFLKSDFYHRPVAHPRHGLKETLFPMQTGTIKWFNATKGYGFIAPDQGDKDVFVHISALEKAGLSSLEEGQKVEFDTVPGRDGRTAADNLQLA